MNNKRNIIKLALNSRILLIVIQYFSNIVLPDHNADAFRYVKTKNTEENFLDTAVQYTLGGFVRWDAHYFMQIAKHGYVYENSLAFFPLLPITVRVIGYGVHYFLPFLSIDSVLLLVFIYLNIGVFVLSAITLYKITVLVFDETVAFKTVVLFCFNPASVFFIAPYTECLFSYLTFQSILGCLLLMKKYSAKDSRFHYSDTFCLIPISLSTVVRSNGILNICFFTYTWVCIFRKYVPRTNIVQKLRYLLNQSLAIGVSSAICLLLFVLFQIYCFDAFCTDYRADLPQEVIDKAVKYKFVLPGEVSKHRQSWCFQYPPLAYSYVQDHYWKVGFLRYYELKQLPNFFLAAPILYIVIKNCAAHVRNVMTRNIANLFSLDEIFVRMDFEKKILHRGLNVFVVHALFLSLFSLLFIHVQVATRMLCSASPIFYWYCVKYLKDHQRIIKIYFAGYFILGTIFFCNFLPWT
nr:GPI mannosyltransferase 2 [Leptinotarsa decemlineata]